MCDMTHSHVWHDPFTCVTWLIGTLRISMCGIGFIVAVCCSVLQCVAVCCSVMHCVAVCCSVQYVFPCVTHTFVTQSCVWHDSFTCDSFECVTRLIHTAIHMPSNWLGVACMRVCVCMCVYVDTYICTRHGVFLRVWEGTYLYTSQGDVWTSPWACAYDMCVSVHGLCMCVRKYIYIYTYTYLHQNSTKKLGVFVQKSLIVAVCRGLLQCVAVCRSALQCVAVCCGVL